MLTRFGRFAVVLALAAVAAGWVPSNALALSCVPPADAVRTADLILVGRVTARPDQATAWLEAERFFKGETSNPVRVDISVIGPNSMWIKTPPRVGERVLVGLRQGRSGWELPICQVYRVLRPDEPIPPELADVLGQGCEAPPPVIPADELDRPSRWRRAEGYLVPMVVALVLIGFYRLRILLRRRGRTGRTGGRRH